MKRCFGWVLLLAAGILLAVASSSYQATHADPPADDNPDASAAADASTNAQILAELKAIRIELKNVNSFMRNGVFRTANMMNVGDLEKENANK